MEVDLTRVVEMRPTRGDVGVRGVELSRNLDEALGSVVRACLDNLTSARWRGVGAGEGEGEGVAMVAEFMCCVAIRSGECAGCRVNSLIMDSESSGMAGAGGEYKWRLAWTPCGILRHCSVEVISGKVGLVGHARPGQRCGEAMGLGKEDSHGSDSESESSQTAGALRGESVLQSDQGRSLRGCGEVVL